MSRRQQGSCQNGQKPADPFDVYLIRHGTCAICRERDEARHHGASFCRGNFRRQHPRCTSDGKRPRFEPDMTMIASIQNDKAPR